MLSLIQRILSEEFPLHWGITVVILKQSELLILHLRKALSWSYQQWLFNTLFQLVSC